MATATTPISGTARNGSAEAQGVSGSFQSQRFPDGMRRNSILRPRYHPDGYLERLDRDTFWYDAIWDAGRLTLVCPPFNNLRRRVRRARFQLDGRDVALARLRRYRRHDLLEFVAPKTPARILVQIGDWQGESGISIAQTDLFAGLNSAFYLSKDNDLEWLVDHARYHKAMHGLQGLVAVDNGSSRYAPEEIEAALAPVGLERLVVLSAPFKFGPLGLTPYRNTEKYLQTAVGNMVRLRYLSRARAVLSCDVDELVYGKDGANVFDAAVTSRLGIVQVPGHWRLPDPEATPPFRHAHHTRVQVPPRDTPSKFCIVPQGPLRRFSWDVHNPERLPFFRRMTDDRFEMIHCRALTTGWKDPGRIAAPDGTVTDPLAEQALAVLRG
ncbi:hypothetical protein VK792_03390 [Mesobacterium sp. TK19101]|uniref:Glycosyltransferase family 2 protein n=1 Tax=Mesobacterium hydrothermale TaxID=3111907 RepID=A0ABU6HE93_9RHOB|nr:hypothetical protein [Mesobacterium sp. TK19101]MEC3860316.1 hypothetical protein [Mesobacterium sp. TK19101]